MISEYYIQDDGVYTICWHERMTSEFNATGMAKHKWSAATYNNLTKIII